MLQRLLGPVADYVVRLANQHRAQQFLTQVRRAGNDVRLRMPVVIYAPEMLEFGDQVDVGEFTHLRANGGLRIGNRVLIAAHVTITTRAHPVALPRWSVTQDAPIEIADDVWIGARAVILPGVTVGKGAVVAAGAVVTSSVDPFTVVGGVPARLIRTIGEPAR